MLQQPRLRSAKLCLDTRDLHCQPPVHLANKRLHLCDGEEVDVRGRHVKKSKLPEDLEGVEDAGGGGVRPSGEELGKALRESFHVLGHAHVAVLHMLLRVVKVGTGEVLVLQRLAQLGAPLPRQLVPHVVHEVVQQIVAQAQLDRVYHEGAVRHHVPRE